MQNTTQCAQAEKQWLCETRIAKTVQWFSSFLSKCQTHKHAAATFFLKAHETVWCSQWKYYWACNTRKTKMVQSFQWFLSQCRIHTHAAETFVLKLHNTVWCLHWTYYRTCPVWKSGRKPDLDMPVSATTMKLPSLLTATPFGKRSPCIRTFAFLVTGSYIKNLPVSSISSIERKNCLHLLSSLVKISSPGRAPVHLQTL